MANILILAAYDLAAVPVVEWLAADHQVRAILGRSALNARMPSDTRELLAPLAEWAWVQDLFNSPETIAVADRWAGHAPFDAVICLDEFGVVTAARLRRRLGIKIGQDVDSALAYRQKDIMHSLVRGHVPVPAQEVVDNAFDLLEAVRRLRLPAMLKPTNSAGGVGNTTLRTMDDVHQALAARGMDFPPAILQAYVAGTILHVDGYVDSDGKLKGPCVSAYDADVLGYQGPGGTRAAPQSRPWALASSMFAADRAESIRLAELTQRVVDRLPPTGGAPVHAEFFGTPSGEFVFCEIASRAGGAGIVSAYRHALGADLFELHTRGQAGEASRVAQILDGMHELRPHGWYLRPVPAGALLSVPTTCPVPGVVDYTVFGRVGQTYQGPSSSVDSMQHFVISGPDFTAAFDALDAWCEQHNVWVPA
jgi:hypothetical protein